MSYLRRGPAADTTQAGFVALKALERPWIGGYLLHEGRTVPVAKTSLSLRDRLGSLAARWGFRRMRHAVLPGLYAAGKPDRASPVFVTANYKMSFDALRSSLEGVDAWMLVLDTKGINVWCAAGKGTFGTGELVRRVASAALSKVVDHRTLILPQLGASGVSAPETARRSGFRVEWGPVRASDLPAYLAAGRVKDARMREVTFALPERMAVAPIEIVHSWPFALAALALALLLGLPANGQWIARAGPLAASLLGAIPVGTVLFPALLPWIPSRPFIVKGAFLGIAWSVFCAAAFSFPPITALGVLLVTAPVSAFLAMNFTGSSTFTCQEGALAEVERGFWPMTVSAAAGLIALTIGRLIGA